MFVNQELGEIPLDRVDEGSSLLCLKPLPQRMSVVPIHIDLTGHVPSDVELLGKLLDLSLGAGLLTSKLIAWEANDSESLGPVGGRRVLLVKGGQLFIVDLGLASPARLKVRGYNGI